MLLGAVRGCSLRVLGGRRPAWHCGNSCAGREGLPHKEPMASLITLPDLRDQDKGGVTARDDEKKVRHNFGGENSSFREFVQALRLLQLYLPQNWLESCSSLLFLNATPFHSNFCWTHLLESLLWNCLTHLQWCRPDGPHFQCSSANHASCSQGIGDMRWETK